MDPTQWAQLGVGVAACLALVYVVRSMQKLLGTVLAFVGNHMSSVTAAQEKVAEALGDIALSTAASATENHELRMTVEESIVATRAEAEAIKTDLRAYRTGLATK